MKYDPAIHHRHSIRLMGCDYSSGGMYHVVVRTKKGVCAFGDVEGNKMHLSPIGTIAERCWTEIPEHFNSVKLDTFQIMPNHVHMILVLKETIVQDGVAGSTEKSSGKGLINQTPTRKDFLGWSLMEDSRVTLGKVVRTFKAKCTKLIHDAGQEQFRWQRDYYDHVIRDGRDLDRLRKYIQENPMNWYIDENHPHNIHMDRLHEWTNDWPPLD